jgi:16S rRNA A1518/A1519 N6-dimethyltransferase RsmA/KsgA/DIM1 with predicted DNA glycosylase/AP lyase activity
VPQPVVLAALEEVGIDSSRRAQTVTLEEFAALAAAMRSRI